MPDDTTGSADPSPLLRVVKGIPDDAELAALVTVVGLLSTGGPTGGPDCRPTPSVSGWAAYWRSLGAPVPTAPGAWAVTGASRP